jgi:hypothetical protein
MGSIREQILTALAEALAGEAAPEGWSVHRAAYRPIEADQLPALVLYEAPSPRGVVETVETIGIGPDAIVRRVLTVRVEIRAEVPQDTAPSAALDPGYVWAVQSIVGAGLLDGLLTEEPAEQSYYTEAEERDRVLAAGTVDFQVEYQTRRGDPETAF